MAAHALILLLTIAIRVTQSALTAKEKEEVVAAHNSLRRSVYPPASDMNFVFWDDKLGTLAQKAADRCDGKHSGGAEYKHVGENVYSGSRDNLTSVVTLWFSEYLKYDYKSHGCNKPNVFNHHSCGHYTQVTYNDVRKVGCARKCGHVYCIYDICQLNRRPYKNGPACSNCQGSAMCYDGLCVVKEDQTKVVSKYNESLACKIVCKNCGQKQETKSECSCKCASGWKGADCSEKAGSTQEPLKCSKCIQQGTPCQNGGTDDKSTEKCSCSCPDKFAGPHCQISSEVYNNSLHLQLESVILFAYNNIKSPRPIDPIKFLKHGWPHLQATIASSVNEYCRQSTDNFAKCCPGAAAPSGGLSGDLLKASDIRYVDSSMRLDPDSITLNLAFNATAKAGNGLCSSGSAGSAVSVPVLAAAIDLAKKSSGDKIKSCCGVKLKSHRASKEGWDDHFCKVLGVRADGSRCPDKSSGSGKGSSSLLSSQVLLLLPLTLCSLAIQFD